MFDFVAPAHKVPRADPRVARVLVVGVIPPLLWAVTRCLARVGIRPYVLGWQRWSPMAWIDDCHYQAMPALRWIGRELHPSLRDTIERTCSQRRIDVIVPADYECSLLLSGSHPLRCPARLCALPDVATLRALHDKWRFACLLERLGLPYPRTELITSVQDLVRTQLRFPIVTKPTDRHASIGVQIHRSAAALERTLAQGGLRAGLPLLAQHFVPGRDVGFGFLARHGKLIAGTAFDHTLRGRRHFEAPALRRHVEVLLDATGYHGVGEVDARCGRDDGRFQLLELNPRFWASLLHTANGGLNFPALLLRMSELGASSMLAAQPGEARLQPYESVVRRGAQVCQRLHELGLALGLEV